MVGDCKVGGTRVSGKPRTVFSESSGAASDHLECGVLGNVAEIQNFPTRHQDLSMEKPATSRKRVHLHTLVDR